MFALKCLPSTKPEVFGSASKRDGGTGSDLQSVFREAELNDALLFFDECESLFVQRDKGGSSQVRRLQH